MFYRNYKSKRPQESSVQVVDLTESLSANVWSAKNRDGSLRCHWSLRRKNPEDAGNPFVSMRVESLFDIPEALVILAKGFSKAEGLSEDLRVDCGEFAVLVQAIVDRLKANGRGTEGEKSGGTEPTLTF